VVYNKAKESQDHNQTKGGVLVKKGDFILLFFIACITLLITMAALPKTSTPAYAEVMVDGVLVGRFSLSEKHEQTLQTPGGVNVLVIQDGMAAICFADCPDQTCVKQGSINRAGQSIICLPHRLVVTLSGDKGVDAIAR
jgi:hypothetical protein